MDKDALTGWLIVVSFIAFFLGLGWYGSANSDTSSSSDDSSSEEVTDSDGRSFGNYQDRIDEYESALYDANEAISRQNSCSDDVFSALDDGDYDSAYEYVQGCNESEISSPGTSL